ncbi:DUF6640 family protein [Streptomyces sp. NEAU-YJ-81]|uniref:DUF6640 family protein n=1 Tax=Streptomyces sp. NEAU-YJ-81 TaxID=2820288 RepID=UPI001ABC32DA|nr:DUF6640 family protein [Streptomyces sp. NEAU-YJ-81]MBO3681999.1 hypothetical protein [Streptomyces sp. NEAU-YJ-81]
MTMTLKPVSKVSRAVVGAALVVTGVGPLLADFVVPRSARQHLHNPNWPPHAKFHNAQYIVMGMLSGGLGLRVLSRRGGDQRAQLYTAAAIGAVPWLGMFGASLFPGTAASDPEFEATEPKVLGMHPQLFLALVLLAGVSGAVTVERARSRRPRRIGG